MRDLPTVAARAGGSVLLACLCSVAAACGSQATLESLEPRVPQPVEAESLSDDRLFSLRDDGRLIAELRVECAEGGGEPIRLDRFQRMPDFVTDATVFLSGWSVQFLGGDQHVTRLATSIHDIALADGILTWRAEGHLADKGFDDRYRWCYHYTVLGWSSAAIDAVVDHARSGNVNAALSRDFTTSQITLPSYVHDEAFAGRTTVPLPRGFAYLVLGFDDAHLLQLAHDWSQVEDLTLPGNYGRLPSPPLPGGRPGLRRGLASWHTRAIFSDNSVNRSVRFDQVFSGFAGSSVGWIEAPFAPKVLAEKASACLGNPPGPPVRIDESFLEDLPFDYAIPILTGWDLSHDCRGDRHLQEAGVWLNHFNYRKEPGQATGSLEVQISSVLRDDDDTTSHNAAHRFSVLGLNRRSGPIVLPEAPETPPVVFQ